IITQPPVGNAEAAPDDVSENVLAPAQPVAPMVPDATGKHLAPKMNSNPPDSAPAIGPSGDSLVGLFIVGLGPSASSPSPRNGAFSSSPPATPCSGAHLFKKKRPEGAASPQTSFDAGPVSP